MQFKYCGRREFFSCILHEKCGNYPTLNLPPSSLWVLLRYYTPFLFVWIPIPEIHINRIYVYIAAKMESSVLLDNLREFWQKLCVCLQTWNNLVITGAFKDVSNVFSINYMFKSSMALQCVSTIICDVRFQNDPTMSKTTKCTVAWSEILEI